MGELEGNLDEGIRTGAALLDQTFAKVIERENVTVHVVGQSPGCSQRALDDILALQGKSKSCMLDLADVALAWLTT